MNDETRWRTAVPVMVSLLMLAGLGLVVVRLVRAAVDLMPVLLAS
ncbi:hypothetical protein [Actinotalea lenta]|nr:hypothetical protein [Isoptericola sp. b490]